MSERGQEEFDIKTVEKEVLLLAVRDPVIYDTFQSCLLETPRTDVGPGILDAFSDSERTRRVHQLWSTTLACLDRNDSIEHFCLELKETLR